MKSVRRVMRGLGFVVTEKASDNRRVGEAKSRRRILSRS